MNKPASVVATARADYLSQLRAVAPTSAEAELRRRLVAIGSERLDQVADDEKRAELWARLVDGWRGCGWLQLYRNPESGTMLGLPDHCDKRLCPWCEPRSLARLRDRYRDAAATAAEERRLYYIVLTVPNVPEGVLGESIDRLYAALGKLRRRRFWADVAAGGLWRLEVTINLRARTWHPHVNVLLETTAPIRMATWQPILQAEWRAVSPRWTDAGWTTGAPDGQWVWLREAGQPTLYEAVKRQHRQGRAIGQDDDEPNAPAVDRAIRYTIKPNPDWVDTRDPGWVVEYVEALAGRRSLNSFGSWRGLPESDPEPGEEELVVAPLAPGENPSIVRRLPALDPLTDDYADWEWCGSGPRRLLRPFRPPGDGRREWLVWHPDLGGGDDPPDVADDGPAPTIQRLLGIGLR